MVKIEINFRFNHLSGFFPSDAMKAFETLLPCLLMDVQVHEKFITSMKMVPFYCYWSIAPLQSFSVFPTYLVWSEKTLVFILAFY